MWFVLDHSFIHHHQLTCHEYSNQLQVFEWLSCKFVVTFKIHKSNVIHMSKLTNLMKAFCKSFVIQSRLNDDIQDFDFVEAKSNVYVKVWRKSLVIQSRLNDDIQNLSFVEAKSNVYVKVWRKSFVIQSRLNDDIQNFDFVEAKSNVYVKIRRKSSSDFPQCNHDWMMLFSTLTLFIWFWISHCEFNESSMQIRCRFFAIRSWLNIVMHFRELRWISIDFISNVYRMNDLNRYIVNLYYVHIYSKRRRDVLKATMKYFFYFQRYFIWRYDI